MQRGRARRKVDPERLKLEMPIRLRDFSAHGYAGHRTSIRVSELRSGGGNPNPVPRFPHPTSELHARMSKPAVSCPNHVKAMVDHVKDAFLI